MRGPFARGQDWKDYLLAREHFDASTITAGAFFVARFTGREETCLVTVISHCRASSADRHAEEALTPETGEGRNVWDIRTVDW